MIFEIFDRSTEKRKSLKDMKMTINRSTQTIRFNVYSKNEMDLQPETFVRFLRFNKQWFVCRTTDGEGYALHNEGKYCMKCHSHIIIRNLANDFGQQGDKEDYILLPTEHEYKGSPLFELIPVSKLKTQEIKEDYKLKTA
jgi:hypothetical protein